MRDAGDPADHGHPSGALPSGGGALVDQQTERAPLGSDAAPTPPPSDDAAAPQIEQKAILRDYLESILICVIFVIFSRAFVFQQSKIPSGSMMDTLLVGDYIMVNRFVFSPRSFGWEDALLPRRQIRRGDVVVFKHPPQPEVDYIKRVVGLPGDRVELRRGYLFVNDKLVDEPYVQNRYRYRQYYGNRDDNVENMAPVTVEPGHYFVMGDHRNASADSREWGPAPGELLKGRAFMILFSTAGEPAAGQRPGQVSPKSLFRKIVNLVFHSRWERCLSFIR